MNSFELNQLTSRIFWSLPVPETDRPILGAVIGSQSVLMVDAGNSPNHAGQFLEALRSHGFIAPTYIALTHYHWDHVFGAAYLDGLLCASMETGEKLREMSRLDWRDKALDQRVEEGLESDFIRSHLKVEMSNIERSKLKLRTPDVTFSQRMIINLGDINCHFLTIGGDHTPDSSVIYIPEEQVVFLGDCLCSGSHNGQYVYTQQKLFSLLDTLLGLDAQHYVSAHLDHVMTRAEMENEARLLKMIGQAVADSKAARALAIQKLEKELGKHPDEDALESLDAFISGYQAA